MKLFIAKYLTIHYNYIKRRYYKMRKIFLVILAAALLSVGCSSKNEDENKASGLTDTQNDIYSNIEVEVG